MFWVGLAHIGLPALFALAVVIFSIAADRGVPEWDRAPEAALEMAILAIGATAAIFENPNIVAAYGEHAATVAISVVGCNLVLAAGIILIRRFFFPPTSGEFWWAGFTMTLGFIALLITSLSLWYGTYHSFTSKAASGAKG